MEGLTERQKEDLDYAYSLYKDSDGFMNARKFQSFLAALNPPVFAPISVIKDILKTIDTSQDGCVNKDEAFNFVAAKQVAGIKEDELRDAFRKFDKSGDARLSRDELMDMMQNYGDDRMTEEEAKEVVDVMLTCYDVDDDGFLRFDEFVNAMFSMM